MAASRRGSGHIDFTYYVDGKLEAATKAFECFIFYYIHIVKASVPVKIFGMNKPSTNT